MNQRVLLVFAQAFLLATAATSARAQSQIDERISQWQTRQSQTATQLAASSIAPQQYGLSGILREFWDGDGWVAESRTTHWYSGRIRSETFDETWSGVRWIPNYFTTYRTDGLVDAIKEWDTGTNSYNPSVRYVYDIAYDVSSGDSAPRVVLTQVWSGVDWKNSERTTYTLDRDPSSGFFITGGRDEVWAGMWIPAIDFRIEQAADDVVETVREWDPDAGQWQSSERTVYRHWTIPALQQELKARAAEYAGFEDLSLFLLSIPDYERDVWDGSSDWMPADRKTTTHWNVWSNKPAIVAYEEWTGQWAESMRHEIEYSVDGKFDKSSLSFGGIPGEEAARETYTYDGRGLITESVTTWDSGGQTELIARHSLSWTSLGVGTEDPELEELPAAHQLNPAYPNPFNPSTTLTYELVASDRVDVSVYDVLGKHIRTLIDETRPAGRHEVVFDASGLPGGVYVVRMTTSRTSQSRPVTLLK